MLIALAQLVAMLRSTRPKKRKERRIWILWRAFENGTVWWFFMVFIYGSWRFLTLPGEASRAEIYFFGASVWCGAAWYTLFVSKVVIRGNTRARAGLEQQIEDLAQQLRSSSFHSHRKRAPSSHMAGCRSEETLANPLRSQAAVLNTLRSKPQARCTAPVSGAIAVFHEGKGAAVLRRCAGTSI